MMHSIASSIPSLGLRAAATAALTLGLVCAAPSSASAISNECTGTSSSVLLVDVSYSGNFYSRDAGLWVGGFDPWEIAAQGGLLGETVEVQLFFYSDGTLTVDNWDYTYVAGDTLLLTFDVDELYYVAANADLQRALLPMPPLPKEPDGPLPQNEVIIAPKKECPGT